MCSTQVPRRGQWGSKCPRKPDIGRYCDEWSRGGPSPQNYVRNKSVGMTSHKSHLVNQEMGPIRFVRATLVAASEALLRLYQPQSA